MGGFFGAVSKRDVVMDVFFGVDYHSHLGTRRAGMIVLDHEDGYQRQIHSIENTPFRTKFEDDIVRFHGTSAIGCISDADPQPLLVRSHLGTFAITTIGAINNAEALVEEYFEDHDAQFMALSSGAVNSTELVAALINQKDDLVAGIQYAQSKIDGSLTLLIMTEDGDIIAAATSWVACRCLWAPTMTATALPSRALPITSWAITTSTSWARRRSCGLHPMPLRCSRRHATR